MSNHKTLKNHRSNPINQSFRVRVNAECYVPENSEHDSSHRVKQKAFWVLISLALITIVTFTVWTKFTPFEDKFITESRPVTTIENICIFNSTPEEDTKISSSEALGVLFSKNLFTRMHYPFLWNSRAIDGVIKTSGFNWHDQWPVIGRTYFKIQRITNIISWCLSIISYNKGHFDSSTDIRRLCISQLRFFDNNIGSKLFPMSAVLLPGEKSQESRKNYHASFGRGYKITTFIKIFFYFVLAVFFIGLAAAFSEEAKQKPIFTVLSLLCWFLAFFFIHAFFSS